MDRYLVLVIILELILVSVKVKVLCFSLTIEKQPSKPCRENERKDNDGDDMNLMFVSGNRKSSNSNRCISQRYFPGPDRWFAGQDGDRYARQHEDVHFRWTV